MDYVGKNRNAWNNEVLKGNYWTKIVDDGAVKRAASGDISIIPFFCLLSLPHKYITLY